MSETDIAPWYHKWLDWVGLDGIRWSLGGMRYRAEMEKHADAADTSVLFFSLAVLFVSCIHGNWQKTLCYQHCAKSNVLKALC